MILNFEKSNIYRQKIHQLIPGGAHTYSKGDDQFPLLSPAAISHGKGAWIWDIDGNKFLDCSMGLTSVSLGHAFEPVLERVQQELLKGVNFQRPSVIEMKMAEKFLNLVPQHDMIKFAKNGSTVTTAAVKLARAFTNRKLVAFPAEHPFYSYDDWFIGSTACDKGIPNDAGNLSVTFKACDIASLEALFQKFPGQIACVISEPEKNFCDNACACGGTPDVFMQKAIDLAHKNGALFIIDEMITGFKTDLPGSIRKYSLEPDMTTWGKGIANGFSFCALTGKKEVMELGGINRKGEEKVFLISTTHGGETHAIAAGLATIDFFENNDVTSHNQQMGAKVISECNNIIERERLTGLVSLSSSSWMPAFVFRNRERQIDAGLRTLMMQEMIKNGVLFQGVLVPSFSHTGTEVNFFLNAFEASLSIYKKALEAGHEKYLIGEAARPVFRKIL